MLNKGKGKCVVLTVGSRSATDLRRAEESEDST